MSVRDHRDERRNEKTRTQQGTTGPHSPHAGAPLTAGGLAERLLLHAPAGSYCSCSNETPRLASSARSTPPPPARPREKQGHLPIQTAQPCSQPDQVLATSSTHIRPVRCYRSTNSVDHASTDRDLSATSTGNCGYRNTAQQRRRRRPP